MEGSFIPPGSISIDVSPLRIAPPKFIYNQISFNSLFKTFLFKSYHEQLIAMCLLETMYL